MESTISQSFHKLACELLKSLKFVDTQKSKNLKMYYESLQNYMYEYISYVNLVGYWVIVDKLGAEPSVEKLHKVTDPFAVFVQREVFHKDEGGFGVGVQDLWAV